MSQAPQSAPDAERAVLGSWLIDPVAGHKARLYLTPTDFYSDANRIIYRKMVALTEAGSAVDVVILAEALRADKVLGEVGGETYLLGLSNSVSAAQHAEHYAKIVRHAALQRALDTQLTRTAEAKTPENVLALRDLVMEIEGVNSDAIFDFQKDLDDAFQAFLKKPERLVYTGFPALDEMMYGIAAGDVVTVGARTNGGKTAYMTKLMLNMSRAGHKVLYLTTEMKPQQMLLRVLPIASAVEAWKFRKHELAEPDLDKIRKAIGKELKDLPISIYGKSQLSLQDIRSAVVRTKPDVVFIDYLQRCRFPKSDNRAYAIGDFMIGLKSFAQEIGTRAFIGCQLDRQRDKDPDKPPTLSDLKDSGAIEAESDSVLLLWKPSTKILSKRQVKPPPKGFQAHELILAKSRNSAADGIIGYEMHGDFVNMCEKVYKEKDLGQTEMPVVDGLEQH